MIVCYYPNSKITPHSRFFQENRRNKHNNPDYLTRDAVFPVDYFAETLYPGYAPIRFNLLNTKPFGIWAGFFFGHKKGLICARNASRHGLGNVLPRFCSPRRAPARLRERFGAFLFRHACWIVSQPREPPGNLGHMGKNAGAGGKEVQNRVVSHFCRATMQK